MNVAVVRGGLGGFSSFVALRRAGIEDVAVFSTEADPAGAWRARAAAIRQREMRSESAGHCLPTTFPGLAVRSALRRRSVRPLVQTLADRFHPTVEEFLAHVEALRDGSGWDDALRSARVERIRAVDGGFELHGHGVFRHVLVAPGHPGLALPAELRGDPR